MDQSVVGWVATHDEPLLIEDMNSDPRRFNVEGLTTQLRTAAVVPLNREA